MEGILSEQRIAYNEENNFVPSTHQSEYGLSPQALGSCWLNDGSDGTGQKARWRSVRSDIWTSRFQIKRRKVCLCFEVSL